MHVKDVYTLNFCKQNGSPQHSYSGLFLILLLGGGGGGGVIVKYRIVLQLKLGIFVLLVSEKKLSLSYINLSMKTIPIHIFEVRKTIPIHISVIGAHSYKD